MVFVSRDSIIFTILDVTFTFLPKIYIGKEFESDITAFAICVCHFGQPSKHEHPPLPLSQRLCVIP